MPGAIDILDRLIILLIRGPYITLQTRGLRKRLVGLSKTSIAYIFATTLVL